MPIKLITREYDHLYWNPDTPENRVRLLRSFVWWLIGLRNNDHDIIIAVLARFPALLLLEPALDANYQAVKANVYPWPDEESATHW